MLDVLCWEELESLSVGVEGNTFWVDMVVEFIQLGYPVFEMAFY